MLAFVKNINVGYTLPSKWTRKLAINSLRVYMSAENVFYWSKRKGLMANFLVHLEGNV